MQAINYIRQDFRCGVINDTKEELRSKFTEQQVSNLPIINRENELLCILSIDDLKDEEIVSFQENLTFFCLKNQHIIEAIEIISTNSLDCLPVTDEQNKYKGTITFSEIAKYLASDTGYKFPGAVIILEINYHDYSLVEISEIIESNGAKILNAALSQKENSSNIFITLKINTKETSSILQAFRRYNYDIHSHYIGQDTMERFYQNRIEEFLKYINM